MPISGGLTPLTGFPGTITGLNQSSYEETIGARKVERINNESNETGAVVVTGPFVDITIGATVLAASAPAYRMSSTLAYNAVNYRVLNTASTSTRTLRRLNFTARKEGSMTYSV